MSPIADIDLLGRYVRRRDLGAFAILLDRHQADLLRTAHALLGDGHAAQDAVQEGFLRLCREAAALVAHAKGRSGLGGWLCTVVRNHCLDQLRRRSHLPASTGDLADAPDPAPAVRDGDDQGAVLWRAVAVLPPLERAAVLLRYRDGLAYQEIASRLDKTVTHVGVLLHQAIERLRGNAPLRQEVTP
jgi:RNA polymerase sigma-70 factor (ECF subfamily)